ncbi:hypothetical protein AGMMS50268_13020 [Spirochaetia bacterium]|nr:hypothetical protein AGMMS50268_13020 [Spirochaetia bacterium]
MEKTYIILPSTNVGNDQLMFNEVKEYIIKALSQKGYIYANNYSEANYALLIDYGIGEPEKITSTYSIPIFGQTGVQSSTTIGNSTYYKPTYGITGSTTNTSTRTEYRRHLDILAYDNQKFLNENEEIQLWHSSAISTGSSNDLRLVMPYMVTALKDYIGTDTKKTINIVLYKNDENVRNLEQK